MLSLLGKELRAQRLFVLLILFLLAINYIGESLTSPVVLTSTSGLYGDELIDLDVDWAISVIVLTLALSYGLLVREFDDRTIEFLDALPASRTQIFVAKWLAAMGTLAVMPIADSVIVLVIRSVSSTSLDRSYHLDWIATSIGLQLVQLFCFLSIGLVLSYLRRFGWLLLGIVMWGLMVVGQFLPDFDPSNLVIGSDPQFYGKRWLVPWGLVTGYLLVGVAALAIAYGLFVGLGSVILRLLAGSSSRGKQVLLLAASIAIGIVFFGLAMQITFSEMDEGDPDAVRVSFPSWATTTRRTEYFDVVFPNNLANRANRLLDGADEIHQQVAGFFGYTDATRISVDMTDYSSHHLGTAYWNKLKIDLTTHEDLPSLRQTLGHETTHVIIESLSDNRLRDNFRSTRFFHEGVATYIERRFYSDQELAQQRLGAAVLHGRKETRFDRLTDNDTLRAEHDTFLAYELGEVFAAAVVRRFGDDALGDLARTFAEKRHSEGLDGIALWRSIFQAAGYSMNEAVDEYYLLLDEAKQLHQETIEKLPPLTPLVDVQENGIFFVIEQTPPESWEAVIRFRPSITAQDNEYWGGAFEADFAMASPRRFVGRVAWYQVGYRHKDRMPIYQPWEKVRLK